MNKKLTLLCLSFAFISAAQEQKFQGQPPIKIVPTHSVPIQKQWKGIFSFSDSEIYFTNNFEGARLNGIVQNNDSTYTTLITPENTPINISPWYAFKIWSKKKRNIHLYLTYQDSVKHRYYPKLSTGGLHWVPLDSLNYTEIEKGDKAFGPGSLPVKAALRLEVGPDTLWVAGQELQTSTHIKKWVDSLADKKFVSRQIIGKSTEGRDLYALIIGKENSKRLVMVISRQHPPEVTGYLAMKAFVETMASNSKLARKFRRKFTVHVVPLMNPDGVDNGHWRHNAGGIDLNRDWSNFNQPETRAVRSFMEERTSTTGGAFIFGIDFHSTWDDIYYTVDPRLNGNMPGLVDDWLEAVKSALPNYEPNIKPNDQLVPTAVSRNYFFVEHWAEALVFELGDNTPRKFLRKKGATSANELMRLILAR